jgi:hypothetical protein
VLQGDDIKSQIGDREYKVQHPREKEDERDHRLLRRAVEGPERSGDPAQDKALDPTGTPCHL